MRTPSGRIAGSGLFYDRYDEESGLPNYFQLYGVKSKSFDYSITRAEWESKNGPVYTYKIEKED